MIRILHLVQCDSCGDAEHTPLTAWSASEARNSARDNGWTRRRRNIGLGVNAWHDLCPSCSDEWDGGAA